MCLLHYVFFFQINYKCKYGESVYVVGNIKSIGSWNPQKAVKLTWSAGHNWSTKLRMIHENREPIQYKYIIAPTHLTGQDTIVWESGTNHTINLFNTSKLFIKLKDEWEHVRVRIAVQNSNLKKRWTSSHQMFLTTNIGTKSSPIEMEIKQMSPKGENKEGSFWTAAFHVPNNISIFNYKLTVTDSSTKERQIDRSSRKFDMKKLPSFIGLGEIYAIIGASLTKFDFSCNTSFNYDMITEEIYVGSFPNSINDVEELLESGMKAVLNLQTFGDMNRYQVDWEHIKKLYEKVDIVVEHYPILDMDNEDLSEKIHKAASLIEKLIKENGKLYVHCSAGKYRSIHSVVCYLWQYKQYKLDDAIELIKKKRKKVKFSIFEEVFGKKIKSPSSFEEMKLEKASSTVY